MANLLCSHVVFLLLFLRSLLTGLNSPPEIYFHHEKFAGFAPELDRIRDYGRSPVEPLDRDFGELGYRTGFSVADTPIDQDCVHGQFSMKVPDRTASPLLLPSSNSRASFVLIPPPLILFPFFFPFLFLSPPATVVLLREFCSKAAAFQVLLLRENEFAAEEVKNSISNLHEILPDSFQVLLTQTEVHWLVNIEHNIAVKDNELTTAYGALIGQQIGL